MTAFQSISCRLCFNVCNENRSLYDEDGRRNEIYALTDKYFAPLFLNMEECKDQLTVICLDCWRHISEFYTFQQSILLAHQMSPAKKRTEVVVTSELHEIEFITIHPKSMETEVQRHNEVRCGEMDTNGSEDFINATTSTFSQNDDDNADPQSGDIVRSEFEEDRESASCNDDEAGHQSEAFVKSEVEFVEYIVTDVSRHREVTTKKMATMISQDRVCGSGDVTSDDQWQGIDDSMGEEFDSPSEYLTESEGSDQTSSTDDEVSLLGYATKTRRVQGEAASRDNNLEKVKGNLVAIPDTNSQNKPKRKYTKRIKRAYTTSLKRTQTLQEYDDLIARWRPNLECMLCTESYASFSLFQQHFDKRHPAEECHLVCCQRKFYHRYEIEKHIHFHNEPNPIKCEKCFKCFARKIHLKSHQKRMHSGKPIPTPFTCPNCPRSYERKKSLINHMENNCNNLSSKQPSYTCDECGRSYMSMQNLRYHTRRAHPDSESVPFKCTICDRVHSDAMSLLDHMSSHTGKPRHTCPFCPKTFLQRGLFYAHLNKSHPTEWAEKKKDNTNTYRCVTCKDVFNTQVALCKHVAANHSGKPMYTCQFCPKTFKSRAGFYAHINNMHREEWEEKKRKAELKKKSYRCTMCENAYETTIELREHQLTH